MREASQNLGDILRAARERKGLTQAHLAERTGIGTRTIMDIENHRGNPRFNILFSIIRELNVPANLIFHVDDAPIEEEMEQFMRDFVSCNDYEKRLVISMASHLLGELRKESHKTATMK